MEESVFRRELERYRPARRSDYFKPQLKDKKATSLVALPPAGPNPHKSLSSASSSSSGIGSVSHATGRPHVHKLHAVGSGSDSTSNNSEGALNNVGADHKDFYELLREAVGGSLGTNQKQVDAFMKGMQEEVKAVPNRTNIDFFEHIAKDVALQK